ncbi:uncharacterized protein LOC116028721 [Ipomoea triloba]|uniref:uncharacterized protein LOC116028721 n=1 Tax=Ipomoea triloba TaxID=35885 RepID=UPI00125E137C|nr:uncharacterized protein LOC116028721 [Ipomoea triloba]
MLSENKNHPSIKATNFQTPRNVKRSQGSEPCVVGVFENTLNSPLSIITQSGNLIKSSISSKNNFEHAVRVNKDKQLSLNIPGTLPLSDVTNVYQTIGECYKSMNMTHWDPTPVRQYSTHMNETFTTPNQIKLSSLTKGLPASDVCLGSSIPLERNRFILQRHDVEVNRSLEVEFAEAAQIKDQVSPSEDGNTHHLSTNDDGKLHVDIVEDIKQDLDEQNVLVKTFRFAKSKMENNPSVEYKIRLIGKRNGDARTYNLPTASEVAALIVGDLSPTSGNRDILVETNSGSLKRINELNPAYLPLQYPLLFLYGEDGYREDIKFNITRKQECGGRVRVSQCEFFAYRMHDRLLFIRNNQKALRCEAYKGLSDALTRGEVDTTHQGKRIILPSSFTGGAGYMIQNYQDAMAICRHKGYPNLFITFTCNPKWPEIQRYLKKCQLKAENRPDIVCRVFKMKLDCLVKEIKAGNLFGVVTAVVYTIEFQKRGLPHAHILIFLEKAPSLSTAACMDNFISTEIPDKEEDYEYYKAVEEFMIHGPCGLHKIEEFMIHGPCGLHKTTSPCMVNNKCLHKTTSPCMVNNKCSKHFPKPCMVNNKCSKHFPKKFVDVSSWDAEGYPIYKRCDNGRFVQKNEVQLDSRYVVPHNRYLILKYRAHINVEWCNQSRSIKYLFKYVSACEAAWRLLSYDVQFRQPPVERLSFHLPDCQSIMFEDDDKIENVLNRPTVNQSMFTAWFDANKTFDAAKQLAYIDMPTKFVWKKDIRQWHPRKRGFAIGRIFYVPPGSVRGPTSFEDIKTFQGVTYATFRDVCYAKGLLDDDKEYIDAINEASQWSTAKAMRRLFVILLTSNLVSRPENVWNAVWHHLAEDMQYNRRTALHDKDICLSEEEKKNLGLIEIERLFQLYNKSLKDYPQMPIPIFDDSWLVHNRLVFEEMAYNRAALDKETEQIEKQLTDEQRVVYDTVINDVCQNMGGLYFVYGYGSTGKTFVWKEISGKIRSKGDIVINVASSGIASLLLPGGRTAHSRFAIPIVLTEDSTCNIIPGSQLA